MKESKFQADFRNKLYELFPGSVILRTDPNTLQGIPDLLVLFEDRWALLELKASPNSPIRPNQAYYVDKFDNMGYSAFVYPENQETVLDSLDAYFRSR